jgi:hypothetical protein
VELASGTAVHAEAVENEVWLELKEALGAGQCALGISLTAAVAATRTERLATI